MQANKIASAIKSFPGMPGTAVKLLALIDDSAMRVSQIEGILRQDPGLTANVLRLANSAFFGIPSKVGSIRQAVILLGLKRLIQMVIAACVSAIMDKSVPGYDLPPGELWRHSIAASVAAEGLVDLYAAVGTTWSASGFTVLVVAPGGTVGGLPVVVKGRYRAGSHDSSPGGETGRPGRDAHDGLIGSIRVEQQTGLT